MFQWKKGTIVNEDWINNKVTNKEIKKKSEIPDNFDPN